MRNKNEASFITCIENGKTIDKWNSSFSAGDKYKIKSILGVDNVTKSGTIKKWRNIKKQTCKTDNIHMKIGRY